ncbi:MAG: adenylate kinase [Clostridia bacterium]|nr:adenylate kinase [Clostridia bacterium]
MNIVLLGAPGAGKGTQASFIKRNFGLIHISTGDIFRENLKNGTELGLMAKKYMDAGQLVPDSVTCDLVKDRLQADDVKKHGCMLDGFPRNIYQAEELEKFCKVDACIDLDVAVDCLMDRICGRRVCSACRENYHISTLDGVTICPKCGAPLIQRNDDNPETVTARLDTYFSQTAYLENYYKDKGKLVKIPCGDLSPDEVYQKIKAYLLELA